MMLPLIVGAVGVAYWFFGGFMFVSEEIVTSLERIGLTVPTDERGQVTPALVVSVIEHLGRQWRTAEATVLTLRRQLKQREAQQKQSADEIANLAKELRETTERLALAELERVQANDLLTSAKKALEDATVRRRKR